jgi:prepilin-type N-terminal cleavage/methylation domain-containing protein
MKRFAFTLLELVFVIVVIGIIAVLAMPNFNSNPLQKAAEQVANHIRYTQHLAMVDDKFDDNNATWYISRWQIRFYERGNPDDYYYTIFSDKDQNHGADYGAGKTEIAIDPLTKLKFHIADNNTNMDLTNKFGIQSVVSSCLTADGTLVTSNKGVFAFDNLGRPYNGISNATSPYQYLMVSDCNITLTHSDGTATITVRPETGYVSVSYN